MSPSQDFASTPTACPTSDDGKVSVLGLASPASKPLGLTLHFDLHNYLVAHDERTAAHAAEREALGGMLAALELVNEQKAHLPSFRAAHDASKAALENYDSVERRPLRVMAKRLQAVAKGGKGGGRRARTGAGKASATSQADTFKKQLAAADKRFGELEKVVEAAKKHIDEADAELKARKEKYGEAGKQFQHAREKALLAEKRCATLLAGHHNLD